MLSDQSYHLDSVRNVPFADPPVVRKAPYQRPRPSCRHSPLDEDWRWSPPPETMTMTRHYLKTAAWANWRIVVRSGAGNWPVESKKGIEHK